MDLDPAPHQSDGILGPLVYRPSRAPFWPPDLHCEHPLPYTDLYLNSGASEFYFDLNVDPDPAFHSNADPDPASKIMWIHADLGPQH
jgi:hypothetical protein